VQCLGLTPTLIRAWFYATATLSAAETIIFSLCPEACLLLFLLRKISQDSASDSFTIMELYKSTYLLTYLLIILRKVKDNFLAISRGSLVAMTPCQQ